MNDDISTGDYRYLNLMIEPFNLRPVHSFGHMTDFRIKHVLVLEGPNPLFNNGGIKTVKFAVWAKFASLTVFTFV